MGNKDKPKQLRQGGPYGRMVRIMTDTTQTDDNATPSQYDDLRAEAYTLKAAKGEHLQPHARRLAWLVKERTTTPRYAASMVAAETWDLRNQDPQLPDWASDFYTITGLILMKAQTPDEDLKDYLQTKIRAEVGAAYASLRRAAEEARAGTRKEATLRLLRSLTATMDEERARISNLSQAIKAAGPKVLAPEQADELSEALDTAWIYHKPEES